MSCFFGKYRGKVEQNFDPESRGRIQVSVPEVLGTGRLSWAMPCVPYAGIQAGLYAVPPKNANIWVEFEGGNPERPIWTGCFWGLGETPALALVPPQPVQHILLQTTGQNTLHISDALDPTGGILLKTAKGAMIVINDVGITITNGKGASIALVGNMVSINGTALTVI
ncbi:baseplate assembly protein [Oculatella sp. LEGE 06141]|uniref:phage baseplate assembly protein V n=1 Tax=Oculatella sp. LEGE 06141 TaxID=1828648 RepID=UPI001881120F|nr:phage baseplate assembly protein V [Oculatella sp. LEGE 06141]MBE9180045.1 baseplate assembly protein [Oculatella sp. LEGE 06141]